MDINKLRLTRDELSSCSMRAQPMTAAAELQLAKALWCMLDWLQDRQFAWVAWNFKEVLADSGVPHPSQDVDATGLRQVRRNFPTTGLEGRNDDVSLMIIHPDS